MIVLLAAGWIVAVACVAYKSNHSWPTRRTIRQRLIQRNPYLRVVLTERRSSVILERANRRVLAARRVARRRLVAGLLSVVGAATLINAPVATDRRARHSTGLETILIA